MKIRLFVVALLGLMPALAPDAPETINYQSVPQLLARGEIANVEIYDFGGKGVDAVLTRTDGSTLLVKRPIGLDEVPCFRRISRSTTSPSSCMTANMPGRRAKARSATP